MPRWSWTKINDADKQTAIRLIACGLSVRQAAERINRTQTVVYNWIEGDPEFAEAVNAVLAERDDEATHFRLRVRRSAEEMLDHLLDLADGKLNPNIRERNAAVKTFFEGVHNPLFAPKASAGPAAPVVYVNAQQAALLFAAPAVGEAGDAKSGPAGNGGAADAPGGNGRAGDAAQPAGQIPVAATVQAGPGEAGGDQGGTDAGDLGEAVGE